jgi:hypothetical protein
VMLVGAAAVVPISRTEGRGGGGEVEAVFQT